MANRLCIGLWESKLFPSVPLWLGGVSPRAIK